LPCMVRPAKHGLVSYTGNCVQLQPHDSPASIYQQGHLLADAELTQSSDTLQFTRLAPARGFDSLDDDFSYALLLIALAALAVGSVVAHAYTKAASLNAKWA
jgi:hypothetical protein